MGYHFLLQGIFPTQGLNLSLLHYQVDSFTLSHLGSTTHPPPHYMRGTEKPRGEGWGYILASTTFPLGEGVVQEARQSPNRECSLAQQIQFSSVTQLCLTLQPQGRQHARPPCASPTPLLYFILTFPLIFWKLTQTVLNNYFLSV